MGIMHMPQIYSEAKMDGVMQDEIHMMMKMRVLKGRGIRGCKM